MNLTNSKSFTAWFADSKIVDANGNPRIVYHGTRSGIKSHVDGKAQNGKDWYFNLGSGFYISNDPTEAADYAGDGTALSTEARFQPDVSVIPVYLSLQNPLIIDEVVAKRLTGKTIRRKALQGGHDGIIKRWKNSNDIQIVVFKMNQIKSAIANNGEFNPQNSDITK